MRFPRLIDQIVQHTARLGLSMKSTPGEYENYYIGEQYVSMRIAI